MKIAIFTESYRPVINGVTRSIDTVVAGLRDRGHQTVVYAPRARGFVDTDAGVRRFPSYYFPGAPPDYPFAVPFAPALFAEFARERFDLAHIQTPFAMGLSGLALGRCCGVPVVATLHTHYAEYSHYLYFLPPRGSRWLTTSFVRWFYNRPDVVVAPSPSVRALLQGYGVTPPIYVVPTGVRAPTAIDRAAGRRAFGLPPEVPLLLYTGRLAVEKNVDLLLDAFARIRHAEPTARLLVLGSGPASADAEARTKALGLQEAVQFAGFRPLEEVSLACQAADLYLFPSRTDTQALSVLEAMVCGVPPIVVRAFGPADTVEEGVSGRVVDPDPRSMADAALALIRDPVERKRLGEGSRLRAASFSTERMLDAMLGAYERAIGSPHGQTATSAGEAI